MNLIKRIFYAIYYRLKGISPEELSVAANIKAGMKVGKNCWGLVNCTIDHVYCCLLYTSRCV